MCPHRESDSKFRHYCVESASTWNYILNFTTQNRWCQKRGNIGENVVPASAAVRFVEKYSMNGLVVAIRTLTVATPASGNKTQMRHLEAGFF